MVEGIGLSQTPNKSIELFRSRGNIKTEGEYSDASNLQKKSDSMMSNLFNLDKTDKSKNGLPPAGSSIKTTA